MKKAIGMMLLGLLALPGVAPAAEEIALPPEASQLMIKLNTVQSYRTRFRLEAREETGETAVLEGDLLFERPNRRRMEMRLSGDSEISQMVVSDGQREWQYYPDVQTVYLAKAMERVPGPHRPFAEMMEGTVRFIEWVGQGGEERMRFEGKPIESVTVGAPVPIETIRVEVASADGLVRRLALLDESGNEVLSQAYQQVEINMQIPRDSFQFVPPADVSVVEMDEEGKPSG